MTPPIRRLALTLALCTLILCALGGVAAGEAEPGWKQWQSRYFAARAALEKDPERAQAWKTRPLLPQSVEVTAVLPGFFYRRVRDFRGFEREFCITCHGGIEAMSASHPPEFGCTVCHGGDGSSLEQAAAHDGLIYDPRSGAGRRNPSALSVAHLSCGQTGCHSGHADASRNLVDRVKRSPMGTLAGLISGLRFQWGAQATPSAIYGVHPAPPSASPESSTPETGTVRSLKPLPYFVPWNREQARREYGQVETEQVSHHPADGLLRSTCFQCHLDAPPPPGVHRGRGCAACHVTYTAQGRYAGLDPTIDPNRPGHTAGHRMTVLAPQALCQQCHISLGPRRVRALTATPGPASSPPAAGLPQEDVHFQAGLECVDCHPQSDIMGDGRIFSKQFQAVDIRCPTCHGSYNRHPAVARVQDREDPVIRLSRHYPGFENQVGDWMVVTSSHRKLSNVKVRAGKIVTLSKRTGQAFAPGLIKKTRSHAIPAHQEKLACTACHSAWVPECRGCHLTFNPARKDGGRNPWNPYRFEMQFREPALMVGPDGKVRPMLPQPARTFSAVDRRGNVLPVLNRNGDSIGRYRDFEFINPHGNSGANLAYATHPHSVTRRVRSCASCHLSPPALGMGEGTLRPGENPTGEADTLQAVTLGNLFQVAVEGRAPAKVTPQGQAVAGVHQPGARLFNQEELNRILKVGACLPCHGSYGDRIYRDMEKSYKTAATSKHQKRMEKVLKAR